MHTPDGWIGFGLAVDLASGALFVVLGVLVGFVRPRRVLSTYFAIFLGLIGIAYVFANLAPAYLDLAGTWAIAAYIFAAGTAIPFLVLVALRFPLPLGSKAIRIVAAPLAAMAVLVLVQVVVLGLFIERFGAQEFTGLSPAWFVPGMLVFWGLLDALGFFLLLAAWRLPILSGPTRARFRRQTALVSLALLPYVALASSGHAMTVFSGPRTVFFVGYGGIVVLCLLVGALWFRNAATAEPGERFLFHAIGWAAFALPVLGSAFVLVTHDWNKIGILGLSRFVGVVVLAYAVLRQQLFDIDLRLKWTVNRGTLATAFVSVFFVVEQFVQNWAGQVYGLAAGAVATGLLVFALHPLQRMAKRFADAAMPHVREQDPGYALETKRDAYRQALAIAWSDGVLTSKEMLMLARLRGSLKLSDQDVVKLEGEWARIAPRPPTRKTPSPG